MEAPSSSGRLDEVDELGFANQQLRNVTQQKLLDCWRKCELRATGGFPSYHMYKQALLHAGVPLLPEQVISKLFSELQQGWGEDSDNWNPVLLSESGIDDAMRTISPMLQIEGASTRRSKNRSSRVPKLELRSKSQASSRTTTFRTARTAH